MRSRENGWCIAVAYVFINWVLTLHLKVTEDNFIYHFIVWVSYQLLCINWLIRLISLKVSIRVLKLDSKTFCTMSIASRAVLIRDLYSPVRKIPKLLTIFYLFFQAFGLDFGFASALKRKYRLIVQRAILFLSILSIVVMSVYCAFRYDDIWCWFIVVKNNGFILVLITTRYKLCHLIHDINGICDMTTKQMKILNVITIVYTFLSYMIQITLKIVRCIYEKEPYCGKLNSMFYFIVYYGIALSLDVIVLTQIIITYYLKCGIEVIRVFLEKPNRKLKVYKKSYMAIADCYDKIRPLYDWMVSNLSRYSHFVC